MNKVFAKITQFYNGYHMVDLFVDDTFIGSLYGKDLSIDKSGVDSANYLMSLDITNSIFIDDYKLEIKK